MNSTVRCFFALTAMLLLASVSILHAQTAVTGAITGSVSDASGAAVPDAAVEVTNSDTGVSDQTTTNGSGVYRFPSLVPGTYSVKIKQGNFGQFERKDLVVNAGTTIRVDATMKVGAVATTVTVTTAPR